MCYFIDLITLLCPTACASVTMNTPSDTGVDGEIQLNQRTLDAFIQSITAKLQEDDGYMLCQIHPKFSDVSEPLRQLTKKDQPFQRSFNQIEELLTSAKATAYFDPKKETELITDASPTGLSAILTQRSPSSEEK